MMTMMLGAGTLEQGTISGDVADLQKILTGQGYNTGPIDGNFGLQTAAAVRAFQSSKGLLPDGIVGPLTWDALHGKTTPVTLTPVPVAPTVQRAMFAGSGSMVALGVGVLALMVLTRPGTRRTRQ